MFPRFPSSRKAAWIAAACVATVLSGALAARGDGPGSAPGAPGSPTTPTGNPPGKPYGDDDDAIPKPTIDPGAARKACLDCHAKTEPGLVAAWAGSRHAAKDVSCADCHGIDHSNIFGAKGRVSSKTCGGCHDKIAADFLTSGHAHAFEAMTADPRYAAGGAIDRRACAGCHSIGEKDPLDGSVGRCDGCHVGHDFRAAAAREPENCARCHRGPDHPQAEAYAASKHGIAYAAGHDASRAPTCASCHMPDGAHGRDLSIGLGTGLQGRRLDTDPAPPFRMEAIDAKTARAAREMALDRCVACHARRVAADALAEADDLKREIDRRTGAAARSILSVRAAQGAPAPPLGPDIVPDEARDLERAFFHAWKNPAMTAWKGGYHLSPSHVFNEGLQPLGLELGALADAVEAARRSAPAAPTRAAEPPGRTAEGGAPSRPSPLPASRTAAPGKDSR